MINFFNFLKRNLSKIFIGKLIFICSAVSAYADVENIDNQKLKALLLEGISIVDIREEFEWRETGIIPNSHLITFFDSAGKYNLEKWLIELKTNVKRYDPLIIICRSGRRSLILADYLSSKELFFKVYNVEAGINGWKSESMGVQSVQ
ncbi:MAG: sulfurtransferase [Rhodobacteraceae bacterium]|nr:MAG: sulfurtransferase [Paracoccaceae bacterium]